MAPVVILTHAYWQRRFGGDRSVIGRRLIADSNPAEVIGIMPEGFRFLDMEPAAEVISLITFDRNRLTLDGFNFWSLARLKPGVTARRRQRRHRPDAADLAQRMADIAQHRRTAGVRELADHAGGATVEG